MLNQAVVNLRNLVYNAKNIKKALPKTCKFCAVVKSDAYGHGMVKCASVLYKIVDCFAVATVEEGVILRVSGIDKDILVLSPYIKKDAYTAVKYDLTLSLDDVKDLTYLNTQAKKQKKQVKIHLKINTGMNRLGVTKQAELKEILLALKSSKNVILDGVYSHFSNPQNIKSVKTQTNKFLLANKVLKSYNIKVTKHISASGGFILGEYFDMVRIGILLYGYKPFKTDKITVKPVMQVNSVVLKTRRLSKGESAFYGDKKSRKPQTLAIVGYGYADGLARKQTKDIFNNRCMNLTAVKSSRGKGKYLTVMANADDLAKKYKTISYEVLSTCSKGAEKVYRS